MKLFDKKSIIKILDEDLKDAQLSSMDFADDATKKRAFINVLGARLAMKFLFTKKVEANNLYSLYSIHKILSELDIADIYFEGIKIDVRLVFNKEEIFIPKSHFQYDILPNAYLVLTLEEDLSSVEFLGYFEPKDIDKKNENKDFYFFEKDQLQKPDSFKKFLESYVMTDDFTMSEKETEAAEEKFVEYLDNQLSTRNKQSLIKQLASNIELRERFVEFENFELLSREAVKKEDLFQDNVLEIIGAQKAFDEETEEKATYDPEDVSEVLENILTEEELQEELEEPEEQVVAKATSIEDYFNDIDAEIEELTGAKIETEVEMEKAAEISSKSEGKLLENSVKALTAGLELGAVLAATGGAAAAATGAVAAANTQLQGEIIKGGAEVLSGAINSGFDAPAKENLPEKTEDKTIDFSALDDDDDMTLEELNELLSDSREETENATKIEDVEDVEEVAEIEYIENVDDVEEFELIEEIKEDVEPELVETIESEIDDFVAPEEIIEETPEPKAEAKPETNKETVFEINEDALPEIDFGEGISEEPKETAKEAVKEPEVEEEPTAAIAESEAEAETEEEEEEEEIKTPKQKKEPEFIFESDFETEGISKDTETTATVPVIEEEIEEDKEEAPAAELSTVDEQSEFEKLKAQMQTNEDEDVTSDILDSLPLDKLGIDREALNKNQKPAIEEVEEGSIEDLFSFDEILPQSNTEIPTQTPEAIVEKEDSLEARIRALEESEDEESAQELSKESSKIGEADDDFLAQVDDFLKDIDLSDEQKSLLETSLDLDDDIFLDTTTATINNAQTSTGTTTPLEILTDEATAAAIAQTEEFDEIDDFSEQNDPLKILFEKEKLAEIENDDEETEEKTSLIPPEFYKNKKMVLAASVAGLVILSTIIGVSSMKNAQNAGMPQDMTANAPISTDIQQNPAQQSDMPLPVTEQQTMTPDMAQTSQQAIAPNSAQMNSDMGKAVSDAFLSEPVNATISKVAWEVSEDLAYNDSFRKYLQIAGKNLKLNLQNDLLLTNEMAYSSKIIVDLAIDRNGTLQSSKITVSSGSAQIDKIVLQSVKETLKYLKFPSSELSGATANATLIINF